MSENRLSDNPIIVILGILSACIGIFVFVTGYDNLGNILGREKPVPTATEITKVATSTPEPTPTIAETQDVSITPIPYFPGKIAFSTYFSLVIISSEGKFTVDEGNTNYGGGPVWDPYGTRLAFTCNYPGNQICTIDAQGGNYRQITGENLLLNPAKDGESPSWSPDGSKIVFSGHNECFGGQQDISIMNPDGTDISRIFDKPNDDYHCNFDDASPDWSPNADKIAFSSNRDGAHEIYLMNIDGSGVQRLTFTNGENWSPDWSPDGSRIAYEFNEKVCVMDASGSNQKCIAKGVAPSWSPDGEWIAFSFNRSMPDYEAVYIIRSDGSGDPIFIADGFSPDWHK